MRQSFKTIFQIYLLWALLAIQYSAVAQVNPRDSSVFAPMVQVSYAWQIPSGDMAERFYANSSVGLDVVFKTRSRWIIGVDGRFMFRDKVRETGILDSIKTSNGFVIDRFGEYGEVYLYERGFNFNAKLGYLLINNLPNPNSGIFFTAGIGYLQHKIKLQNKDETIPQIAGPYAKGYDRYTNGIAATQMLGYQLLGNSRLFNVFIAVECVEGFTQNRRSLNFDTRTRDTKKRFDFLFAPRFGVILPLYKKVAKEFYYF